MSLRNPEHAENLFFPSSDGAYCHDILRWPDGFAICRAPQCTAAAFGRQCHAVKAAIAQFKTPNADEIAANEAIAPYGETEELLSASRCGLPCFHAANEAAWCDECDDYLERIKAMALRDWEIKRLNAAAAKLALTPIAHDAQSLANQREMEQIAVEFLEARSFADYAAVLSAPLVTALGESLARESVML